MNSYTTAMQVKTCGDTHHTTLEKETRHTEIWTGKPAQQPIHFYQCTRQESTCTDATRPKV